MEVDGLEPRELACFPGCLPDVNHIDVLHLIFEPMLKRPFRKAPRLSEMIKNDENNDPESNGALYHEWSAPFNLSALKALLSDPFKQPHSLLSEWSAPFNSEHSIFNWIDQLERSAYPPLQGSAPFTKELSI